jgi:hypothetical protein
VLKDFYLGVAVASCSHRLALNPDNNLLIRVDLNSLSLMFLIAAYGCVFAERIHGNATFSWCG